MYSEILQKFLKNFETKYSVEIIIVILFELTSKYNRKMRKIGKNLQWKNEKKLRELTSDVFRQVKICCLHHQLFISITFEGAK